MNAKDVRERLEQAGLNQCEAARLLGVSPRTMRRYVSLGEPTEMPGPTRTLFILLTDQLVAAQTARRRRPKRRQ